MKIDPTHKKRMRTAQLFLMIMLVLGTCCFIYETTRIRPDYIPVNQKTITYLERLLIIVFLLCIAFALLLTILVFNFIYELLEQNAIEIQPTQNTNSVQVGPKLDATSSVPDTQSRNIRQPEHEPAEHVENKLEEPIKWLPRLVHVPVEHVEHELEESIRLLPRLERIPGEHVEHEESIRLLPRLEHIPGEHVEHELEEPITSLPRYVPGEHVKHELEELVRSLPRQEHVSAEQIEYELDERIRSLVAFALQGREKGAPEYEEMELKLEMRIRSLLEFALHFKENDFTGRERRALSNSPNNEEEEWYDIAPTEFAVERMPIAQRETHTRNFDTVEQHEDNRQTLLERIPLPPLPELRNYEDEDEGKYDIACGPIVNEGWQEIEFVSLANTSASESGNNSPQKRDTMPHRAERTCPAIKRTQTLYSFTQLQQSGILPIQQPPLILSSQEGNRNEEREEQQHIQVAESKSPQTADGRTTQITIEQTPQSTHQELNQKRKTAKGVSKFEPLHLQVRGKDVQRQPTGTSESFKSPTQEEHIETTCRPEEAVSSEAGGRDAPGESNSVSKSTTLQKNETGDDFKQEHVPKQQELGEQDSKDAVHVSADGKLSESSELPQQKEDQKHFTKETDSQQLSVLEKSTKQEPDELGKETSRNVETLKRFGNEDADDSKQGQGRPPAEESAQSQGTTIQHLDQIRKNNGQVLPDSKLSNGSKLLQVRVASESILQEKEKPDEGSKQEHVRQKESVHREQPAQPQEMAAQGHDQPCKIAGYIPTDEKFSGRSELPRVQIQQEENFEDDSSKGAKVQQTSPNMKQESGKSGSSVEEGEDESFKDLTSSTEPVSQYKDKVEQVVVGDHRQDGKDTEHAPPENKISKSFDLPPSQVYQKADSKSDYFKGAKLQQLSPSGQSIQIPSDTEQESEKLVGSKAEEKGKPIKDSLSLLTSVSQQHDKADDIKKQQVLEIETQPVEQPAQPQDAVTQDSTEAKQDVGVLDNQKLPHQIQQDEVVQSDSSNGAETQQPFISEQSIEMNSSIKKDSKNEAGDPVEGQVDDFKGEPSNDHAPPSKQEEEQTHDLKDTSVEKCEQPQQSTARDDYRNKKGTDMFPKESELPHMHIQEEKDAQSDYLKETKTESSASGPNMETFGIVKHISEPSVSDEMERRQAYDLKDVPAKDSMGSSAAKQETDEDYAADIQIRIQGAEGLPVIILEHTDEERPVIESDILLIDEAAGGASPEIVEFISLRKTKKRKGSVQFESSKHLKYNPSKGSELSEDGTNQERLTHEIQNITEQEQCKTELEATEQDTQPTDDTEQQCVHDVFGYKLSTSDGTKATEQQQVESILTEEQEQEGYDEVDVNVECQPSGEPNIADVVESLEEKPSSSENTGNQKEQCESGCMTSEQLEEASTLQDQAKSIHDDDDVEEHQGEGERERTDGSRQRPVWFKSRSTKKYKGKNKKDK